MTDIVTTSKTIEEIEIEEKMFSLADLKFKQEEREALVMISAGCWPDHLRTVGDYFVVKKLSEIFGHDPLQIANEVYLVKGKFGFSAKFCTEEFNKSTKWRRIMEWEEKVVDGVTEIRAFATLKPTVEDDIDEDGNPIKVRIDEKTYYGPWITKAYVSAQGWLKNSQWVTNYDQMAKYRAATMFIKLYASETLRGGNVAEDMRDDVAIEVNTIEKKATVSSSVSAEMCSIGAVKDKQKIITIEEE